MPRSYATSVGSGSSGSSNFQFPTSGSINGSNATFVWTTAPKVIVVDQGRTIAKTTYGGLTTNWTGTTTTILTVPPTFDIFAIA